MSALHHGGHGSADDQYGYTPPDAGYEHTDANTRIIGHFLFWLGIAAIVVHVAMWGVFALFVEQRRATGEPEFPLATGVEREPPAPRLQQFPSWEFQDFRRHEEALLQGAGWIDREAGIAHIPIDDAKRIAVERGFPSRPAAAGDNDTVGRRPAGSSAGRTLAGRPVP